MVVQNNEEGFTEKDLWALCGIEGTTESDKTLGYRGEKGIGFKSVFMVADEVQIYSNGFHFGFVYDRGRPITMLIPNWIDEVPSFVDFQQTNIILYLREDVKKKVREYMGKIHLSVFLFLNCLKKLEIVDEETGEFKTMELHKKEGGIYEVVSGGDKVYWRVIRKKFELAM